MAKKFYQSLGPSLHRGSTVLERNLKGDLKSNLKPSLPSIYDIF